MQKKIETVSTIGNGSKQKKMQILSESAFNTLLMRYKLLNA